jgi:transposase
MSSWELDFDPKEAEMKYCGIDLHSNNSVVLVSDEEDRMVLQKRLPNDLGQIQAALEPHRDELVGVVIESTFNWYWLVDGLMDAGYRVHLAHPSAIKKYEGLKYSGDFADAGYLAQLLRLGLLAEGYIYPRAERGARDLSRKRMQLVRYRTAQILAIENILARQTGARAERRGGQAADGRAGRGTRLCGRCGAGRGGQPRGEPNAGATDRSVGEAA